jgi:carbon dioxide concentrating mechanism protein CcmN
MSSQLRSLTRELVPVHLYGTVSIDPTAVIAPGVLLQAEANSRIVIGSGVCIGAGTIVQAAGGLLEIGAGACLGREVLVVGRGWIGVNACIGAACTLLDPQLSESAVVTPHAVVGDSSRRTPCERSREEPQDQEPVSTAKIPTAKVPVVKPPEDDTLDVWDNTAADPSSAIELKSASPAVRSTVAGRAQFELLKKSLFPHSG